MRYCELFRRALKMIANHERALEIELLMERAFRLTRSQFWTRQEQEITDISGRRRFQSYFRRLLRDEPVSYILGQKEFYSVQFRVNRHVLIPRPETEILVETALSHIQASCHVLDIGCGCGTISIILLLRSPAMVTAIDNSREALHVFAHNLRRWQLTSRAKPILADLFPEEGEKFDLIVSNPPYLSKKEWPLLPPSIRQYEPRTALVAGTQGIETIARIIGAAPRYLQSGGYLLLEHGAGQQQAVHALLKQHGFRTIRHLRDFTGLYRVASARL